MINAVIKYEKFQVLCYATCIFLFAIGHTKLQYLSPIIETIVKYGKFLPVLFSAIFFFRTFRLYKKVFFFIILFIGLLLYAFMIKDISYTIFFIIYFIIVCKDSKEKFIYKYYTLVIFFVIVLTYIFTFIGIVENNSNIYKRYDLGFTYTTFGPNLFFSACITLICWKKNKVGWKWFIFVLALNQFFYYKTNTDAVYLCTITLFIIHLLMNFQQIVQFIEKSKIVKFILSNSAIILLVFTLIMQLYYNAHYSQSTMIWLNKILSTRLHMGHMVMNRYGSNSIIRELLFGMDPELATYLDSSFLATMTAYGLPLLFIFCYLMNYIARKTYKSQDYYVTIAILVFMIHCVTDPQLTSFRCNPIIITSLIYYSSEKNKRVIGINYYK